MIRRDVPAFNVATRGLAYFHVVLRSGERDLHSGHLRRRGAERRARARAHAVEGRRAPTAGSPSRCGAGSSRRPPRSSPAGRAAVREAELAEQGAKPSDPRAAEEFYLRTFAEPALDVNGFESGSPHLQKTVLPVEAVANLSIRLAPGQGVDEIAPALERLLREAAPEGAELEIELLVVVAARPRSARRRRRSSSASTPSSASVGRRPALIRSGGYAADRPGARRAAASRRSSPASACPTRTSTRRTSGSSPSYVPLGIAAARELYLELAKL